MVFRFITFPQRQQGYAGRVLAWFARAHVLCRPCVVVQTRIVRGIKDIFIRVAEQMLKCCHVLTLFGVGYAWL